MPQEPKKRHSRQRQGKRRAAISLTIRKAVRCPNCNAIVPSHTLCKTCGYYDKQQILAIKEKREEKEKVSK